MIVLWLSCSTMGVLLAQTDTNVSIPGPGQIAQEITNSAPINPVEANASATNTVPASPVVTLSTPATTPAATSTLSNPTETRTVVTAFNSTGIVLAALLSLASLGGFLLYYCGLTRAKNCAHTSTLLLLGVTFALIGYWIGGFAVQTGGIGDAHAALAQPLAPAEKNGLDHELGFIALGHHWGIMGSSGFFLATDDGARNSTALLFLTQAALLVIAVASALGAALERARILAMVVSAYLIGVLIYPLLANWVWGGGWLAELGREYGLGHGFIDLAGASVVHQTAGTLALVIAIVLGPRYGRFGRNKASSAIPGHNVPFILLGSMTLLLSWTATNAFAFSGAQASSGSEGTVGSTSGLAAINTLLAATGGLLISYLLATKQRRRPEPTLICRGLLGGAVASCGCSALVDPWAAFVIGAIAGLIVPGAMAILERNRIDDPTGAFAVHGAAGAWGVVATGFFANGSAGYGLNGVTGPVRGLLFGGAGHQLVAQTIGCITGFIVVFVLGYACLLIVQKIVGMRVSLEDEAEGLDWPQTGSLGYQSDAEPEDFSRPEGAPKA